MEDIEKLRSLIWDKDKEVFPDDPELQEYLDDCGGDVYAAAALCLKVITANPSRVKSYKKGGKSVKLADLKNAIEQYEDMAEKEPGQDRITTVSTKKVY